VGTPLQHLAAGLLLRLHPFNSSTVTSALASRNPRTTTSPRSPPGPCEEERDRLPASRQAARRGRFSLAWTGLSRGALRSVFGPRSLVALEKTAELVLRNQLQVGILKLAAGRVDAFDPCFCFPGRTAGNPQPRRMIPRANSTRNPLFVLGQVLASRGFQCVAESVRGADSRNSSTLLGSKSSSSLRDPSNSTGLCSGSANGRKSGRCRPGCGI